MSPDYRQIYNEIISSNEHYNLAENSPGFLNCVKNLDRLRMLHGRALDVGCGVGFVCQLLREPPCRLDVYGVDVSDEAIARTRQRLKHLDNDDGQRFQRIENCCLPYPAHHFSLVTCFDVLEHLDESDIQVLNAEITRILRRGGIFFGSVSCRPAGAVDLHGDNLHRTVKKFDWWFETLEPDEATFERHDGQLTFWKKNRTKTRA